MDEFADDLTGLGTSAQRFTGWCLYELCGVSKDDIVDSIVDGGNDHGIDAIYVPDDGGKPIVMQNKLIQKHDKNFPATDIIKTLNGVDWLLNGDLDDSTNALFKQKAMEFREFYITQFPPVDIVIAATCNEPSENGDAEVKKFLNKSNEINDTFSFQFYGIADLFHIYIRNIRKTSPNKIEFHLVNKPYEHETGNTRSVIGTVKAEALADVFDKYGNSIFEANIRNYLGNVKINKSIIRTASDPEDSSNFWFYNNGVTFVCEDFSYRSISDTSRISLTNAQIINGCQTVISLYRSKIDNSLQEDAQVLIRVVEKSDHDFVQKVTFNTNSQNAVKAEDLVGRDVIQEQLKRDLERLGYYYETRRGDFVADYPNSNERKDKFGQDYRNKKITLKEAAQAYAAFFLNLPVVAKSKNSSLFYGPSDNGYYKSIFNDENISAARIIGSVELLRKIKTTSKTRLSKKSSKMGWLAHADFFLLSVFNRRYYNSSAAFKEYDVKYFSWTQIKFDTLYRSITSIINMHIKEVSDSSSYNHPKYFKSEKGYTEIISLFHDPKLYIPES